MRSLSAFVACAFSSSAIAQETPPSTKSLFGFELQLDRVATWKDAHGVEYVGWPKADAEAILNVFEKRIPLLLKINEDCEKLEKLDDAREAIYTSAKAALNDRSEAERAIKEVWKEAALQIAPSFLERIFTSWELWFILGLVGGTIFGATLTKQAQSQ